MTFPAQFLRALILFPLFAVTAAVAAEPASYEAPLPVQLSTDPDLCAYAPCRDVMPAADSFSRRKGRPSYVEAYRSENGKPALVGYVFLSTDIVDIPAYSGKPVVTLLGMDTKGVITGVRILKHSEPILLVGIPESELTKFTKQYLGKFVGDKIEVGSAREGTIGVDAISGATVTVIAENQVILRSGYEIAKQVGILKARERPAARFTPLAERIDWRALVRKGLVQRLTVDPDDLGEFPTGEPYIDMYFGYLNLPTVGRSVLGDDNYERLMAGLKPGEHAIFIVANGTSSFKGSGFVRGGIYDRIQVAQDLDTFTFRDLDYLNLYGIQAPGAPTFRESGVFIVRGGRFSAAYPWSLVFLGNRIDQQTGHRSFVNFDREYWLPDRYLEGGRPVWERPLPLWVKIWQARWIEIVLFTLVLVAAATMYAVRDRLVRRAERKDKRWVAIPKYALWLVSIGFVGFTLMAQPSITQVLTWFHSILFKWEWELFLTDPFIFLFWVFVIVTTFFWGRGMFCGWLCPYGAMTEVAFKVAGKLGLKRFQFHLPKQLHDKLKWTKYVVFAGLLAVSFYSMGLAEKLAEVEPFKTTFLVGVWNRTWPFVTFWVVLFAASLFMERPFCKYLCPLGASLAVPSTFRWWGLKRKAECGPCDACAVGCASLAIDKTGRIDQRECLLCLDCMVMYYDPKSCPPLAHERKLRQKRHEPLTAIGADGYYIPIVPVAAAPAPAEPRLGWAAWLRAEFIDHLLPWSGKFLTRPILFQATGVAFAVLVTWGWLLGAAGKLGPGIILGWWLAWSVYELIVRMFCKPYVKEGPWWGRRFRPATWADMMSYVAMKNLLIGAALFLIMKGVGVLAFLRGLPELRWLY
ncbi:MAG: 4Fe-4S binding protein [Gammaproteobacteria bacterium]|nr:MAG: 4Fe-4S binding protein [Gammaproteobacteria bacterium]